MQIGAKAEYAALKKVLMYRPGEEVSVVKESNKSHFLYREPVDWKKFQRQHDAFTSLLKGEGIEVVFVNDFLKTSPEGFPNLTFSRDICSITKKGAILCNMEKAARRKEPEIYGEALADLGIPVSYKMKNLLEGGDFVYLSNEILLLGFGQRTSLAGALEASEFLLDGIVEEIVAVRLPDFRVHLDGGMMILSPDKALMHKSSFRLPSLVLGKERREVLLSDFLRDEGFDIIEVPDEESRTFGSNVVCLGKGKLVSYGWNRRVIASLEEEGFDVIAFDGFEIAKAGGGPHCLTCPILRE